MVFLSSRTLPGQGYASRSLSAAVKGFETFDPTHIFFGSDYPMWEPGIELERVLALGLDDRLLELVLSENFKNFLAL